MMRIQMILLMPCGPLLMLLLLRYCLCLLSLLHGVLYGTRSEWENECDNARTLRERARCGARVRHASAHDEVLPEPFEWLLGRWGNDTTDQMFGRRRSVLFFYHSLHRLALKCIPYQMSSKNHFLPAMMAHLKSCCTRCGNREENQPQIGFKIKYNMTVKRLRRVR